MRARIVSAAVPLGVICAASVMLASPTWAAGKPAAPPAHSREYAGYSANGANFRFVRARVTLPHGASFSKEIAHFRLSVQLRSSRQVLVLGLAHRSAKGHFWPAVTVFNAKTRTLVCGTGGPKRQRCPGLPRAWRNGSASYAPGKSVRLSIYYDASTGFDQFAVQPAGAAKPLLWTPRDDFGRHERYTSVRVGADLGCSPWARCGARYRAPRSEMRLAPFKDIRITTQNGHHAGFTSWWRTKPVVMTSNGKPRGNREAGPHPLWSTGRNFDVFLLP